MADANRVGRGFFDRGEEGSREAHGRRLPRISAGLRQSGGAAPEPSERRAVAAGTREDVGDPGYHPGVKRGGWTLAFLTGGAALLALLARRLPSPDLHVPALSAVPAGATFLALARPVELRAAGLWKLPVGALPARLLQRVSSTCGKDPLEGVDEIAVATPASALDGAFGIAVTGVFRAAPWEACLLRLARDDGKSLDVRRPEERDRFVRLTDPSGDGQATIALADGVLLAGSARYVADMRETLAGRRVSAATDPLHAGLRRDAPASALIASLRLTADTREAIRLEIRDPTAPAARIVGLLGSVTLGQKTTLRAVVACEDDAAGRAMTDVLARLADDAEASTTARFLGLVPLLRTRTLATEGRAAVLTAVATPETAAALGAALGAALAPP